MKVRESQGALEESSGMTVKMYKFYFYLLQCCFDEILLLFIFVSVFPM